MTKIHHPSDATLFAFAGGRLDEGRAVVVAAHVETCPTCQRFVANMETLGGVILADMEPVAMSASSLERALAALEQPVPAAPARRPRSEADHENLPEALSPYSVGPWRWIGPGLHWRSVDVPVSTGARVFMLKAAPGTRLPEHTHSGSELTLVLSGAFSHDAGRFGPGDFEEADDTVDHQPIVAPGEDCICLVAMVGDLRLKGLAGRILQPFVRL